MRSSSKHDFAAYVGSRRGRLSELIADLVRRPSENKPPYGFEGECQKYTAAHLKRCGAEVLVYEPDQAPGITDHGAFLARTQLQRAPECRRQNCRSRGRTLVNSVRPYRYSSGWIGTVELRSVRSRDQRGPALRTRSE